MGYFDDLTFVAWDHLPRCQAWIDQTFVGYYAFNFARQGALLWRDPAGRLARRAAPVAWWTWPGGRFAYGVQPPDRWDHSYVTFRGPRARRLFHAGLVPADPRRCVTDVGTPERMAACFDRLLGLLAAGAQHPRAVHLLEELLLLAAECRTRAAADPLDSPLDGLIDDIRAHPQRGWDFHRQARRLARSYPQFCRLFKRRTGQPPHRFVLSCRLERAAGQLRRGERSVKALAADLGYHDPFHFSHAFKARFGVAPSEFHRRFAGLYDPGD